MRLTSVALILTLCMATACERGAKPKTEVPAGPLVITTTFFPTAYFARRIGGQFITIRCPLPAEADPIFWQPTAEDIGLFQKADLIVINGAAFEKWVEKVSLPDARVIDCAEPFRSQWLRFEEATTHQHGKAGEHSHEGIDGHTWLDPIQARIEARQIHDALAARLPEHRDALRVNFKTLLADLDDLHAQFTALGASPPLLASHPAYNYLARRYQWNITNLDLDPEQMPSEDAMAQIKAKAKSTGAKTLLWESEPAPEIAKRLLTEIGLTSVVFSPAEMADDINSADYLVIMHANIERLKPVFKP